ncbi:TetR/AcrR family transcriptional regulator [Streptomyces iconiensis]|uniref:TetR-like C-terminal domain-containing protein n=1 Tax=Streptomyces iconiensis TaxID=1384038 RepID=A0ABT6ZPW1_9ACTN|nr:TetR-like C-terminal domain-containing protein [Streptomyces iconiensis]MDJ1131091.1 TetR-like C-terminal domain-containing protein [Streptomyces iconiensis]
MAGDVNAVNIGQDGGMEANSRATRDASATGQAGARGRYHHGDLRNALLRAAIDLARDGGPDAVVLRAAARAAGVSATAAYRHFAGQAELLHAVKEYAQERLVDRMEESGREVEGEGVEAVVERVRALGRGYVMFAMEEPGLFRAAFCRETIGSVSLDQEGAARALSRRWESRSFDLLIETLDSLVACGKMAPERRPGAELSAWAMVHGVATLILDGPLADLGPEQVRHVIERALTDVIEGLTAR